MQGCKLQQFLQHLELNSCAWVAHNHSGACGRLEHDRLEHGEQRHDGQHDEQQVQHGGLDGH